MDAAISDWLLEGDPSIRWQVQRDVVGHRGKDGWWPIHQNYGGQVWFDMESGRAPGRWNTSRGLRVLRWWGKPGAAIGSVV